MKKLLYIALVSLSVNAFAQEDMSSDEVMTTSEETSSASPNLSKSGKQLTPVAGDIGIGIEAGPFFQWAGNIFGFTGNNTALSGNVGTAAAGSVGTDVNVRYFLDEGMAVRVRAGFTNRIDIDSDNNITDDANAIDPNAYVMNRYVEADGQYRLAAGVEMRRTRDRIQGYYGGDITFSRTSYKYFEEYGNAPTIDNQQPSGYSTFIAQYNPTRMTIGVAGVIGAEYFFAPSMSLGAEFNLGLIYANDINDGEVQDQEWSDDGLEIRVTPIDRNKNYGWNTDPNSELMLNIYF